MKEKMSVCMEAATTANARKACVDQTAKDALAASLGKLPDQISPAELMGFVNGAARDNVKGAMVACMKDATTKAARQECRDMSAKQALAESLGKEQAEVSPVELNEFLSEAAMSEVQETMMTCAEQAAGDIHALKLCRVKLTIVAFMI